MRVVIADDSLITRAGVERAARTTSAATSWRRSATAPPHSRACASYAPDVAIVDIRMPPTHTDEGLTVAVQIRAESPSTAVLVLSQYVQPSYAIRLLESYPGGMGYLLKDRLTDSAMLLDALRRLCDGECVIDPTIVAQCMKQRANRSALDTLTKRERDVLAQLAEGRSNAGIAAALFIAERTVETHTTQIFQKLDLDSSADTHRRVLAVIAYLRSTD